MGTTTNHSWATAASLQVWGNNTSAGDVYLYSIESRAAMVDD